MADTCEHCGAIVNGDVCEYCGIRLKENPPVKIIYKSDKSESTISFPTKKKSRLPVLLTVLAIILIPSVTAFRKSEKQKSAELKPVRNTAVHTESQHDGKEHHTENRPEYDADEILRETGAFPDTKVYQIGVDIPEGLYIFIPTLSMGHGVQGVYSDPSCNNQISSAYVHFDGTRIVELKGNGYLEFSWCTAYNLDMHPEIVNDPHETDGMFIVGRDIEAGTYHLESPEKIFGDMSDYAEWFIYSDINAVGPLTKECGILETWGAYDENISNEITVHDGEYFELRHCIITD
ncbi:MAG: hypothetical protein K2J08_09645 [Ruminococcus sp.]|nr:hypothetical protein [Ruminococcus sp.]